MSHCRSTAQLDYRSRSGACQQPGKVGGTFPKYKSAVTKDKGKRYMYYVTVLVACLCSAACMWSVLKVGNEKCWYGTLSIFPSLSSLPCPSFLFPLPFPPFLLYPFPVPGSPPPNPATRSGEHYELPRQVWPGRQTVSGTFWVENHAPCDSAIAEVFRWSSMHCDPYWHCYIPVWYFSEKKWRYGFKSAKEVPVWHTISLPALVYTLWLELILHQYFVDKMLIVQHIYTV